jgi:hypothetical protein
MLAHPKIFPSDFRLVPAAGNQVGNHQPLASEIIAVYAGVAIA